MGRLLPLTIPTYPENASQNIPAVFSKASVSRNVCNAKPIAPRLMVPSLPSHRGEKTHIESITEG